MKTNESNQIPAALLKFSQVRQLTGLSTRVLERLIAEGNFAPMLNITPGLRLFRTVDVMAWIDSRPVVTKEGA